MQVVGIIGFRVAYWKPLIFGIVFDSANSIEDFSSTPILENILVNLGRGPKETCPRRSVNKSIEIKALNRDIKKTTMLLPIVPTVVTKVHDDKDFDANYYHHLFRKQLKEGQLDLHELQKLVELRKQQQQQQQQQQQVYKLQLFLSPNDSYNRNNNRNDYRNVLQNQQRLQRTPANTNEEKCAAKNQLQQQEQPKLEPKTPAPDPGLQLDLQLGEEPTPNQMPDLKEYDSKPVSLFDLLENVELEDVKLEDVKLEDVKLEGVKLDEKLGNLNRKPEPKFELEESNLLQLHENLKPIKSLSISKLGSLYEENCARRKFANIMEDSEDIFADSESKNLPLPQKIIDFEDQQFKAYSAARTIKLLKRQMFMNKRSPYVILRPRIKRSRDFFEVYHASFSAIRTSVKNVKNFNCHSSQFLKSLETNNPVPSNSPEAHSSGSSTSSEVDNCLHYMSDEEDKYLTRCKNKAARAFKNAEEECLKEWHSWKQSDSFQTDLSEDEAIDSRTAIKEEQQSCQHQLNMSQRMAQFSVRTSPSLLKPLSSRASYKSPGTSYTSLEASYTSSEASSSSSEASTSSLEILPSPTAIKNSMNNEDNQRITRRKHEEIQQQMAYNIKKSTLNDHCYHQTNVSETLQVFKEELETEESEDEEAIIDVVSVKTGRKQVSFAKQVTRFDVALQRKVKYEDSDDDEEPPPVPRRPRGRPPGSSKRKANRSGAVPKRTRIQTNVHIDDQQSEQPFTSYQYQNSMRQFALQRDSSEDTERRRLHNDMERQRRVNMKQSYEHLRMEVPAVADNDRASKVSILKQGATFIKSLTELDNVLKIKAIPLRQKNAMLKRQLRKLERQLQNEKLLSTA
ncbi:PREDICTED: myb-like protein P [Trachymyrmex septentrionalis]|uniref:myb-like protein P n=1 Tax=Trachymyrmex septentrionalis TaxID=34720 RepID=UPI00084EE287|nr:PREDICTED: myb-like protein P [Trachymyrmex septentrionalis]